MFRLVVALFLASGLFAQQNGKLQLHFMDVGQGDSAVLISPKGQVVLFDAGEDMRTKSCEKPLAYLKQLGIGKFDYVVVSHYHFDHIGCMPEVLAQFPLTGTAYDRGASYPGATYQKYVAAVAEHRKTAVAGQVIRLDEGTSSEVDLTVVAVNGAGISTTNENDLSVAVLLNFGPFKAEIGGDLSGANTGSYADIETTVAPLVGRLDVYKVHHHCSSYSSNEAWLTTTRPAVGIISTGDGNDYHHPAADCVTRLHAQKVATYWTETGAGATPEAGVDTRWRQRCGAGSARRYDVHGCHERGQLSHVRNRRSERRHAPSSASDARRGRPAGARRNRRAQVLLEQEVFGVPLLRMRHGGAHRCGQTGAGRHPSKGQEAAPELPSGAGEAMRG